MACCCNKNSHPTHLWGGWQMCSASQLQFFHFENWRANWTVLRLFLTETTYGTQTQRPQWLKGIFHGGPRAAVWNIYEYVTQWLGLQDPLFYSCMIVPRQWQVLPLLNINPQFHEGTPARCWNGEVVATELRKSRSNRGWGARSQIPCTPRVFLMSCFSMSVFHRLEEIENYHHQW